MPLTRAPILRSIILGAVVVALAAPPTPLAEASHRSSYASGPEHEFGEMVDYPLVFPVDGPNWFADWFWAPRGSGIHHAIDIMADRWIPVLSVADGVIHAVNYSTNPNNLNEDRCCTLIIQHDDGWRSWYIHLNNDSAGLPPGTCDGQGWGIVDGILPGVRVYAGQHVGWVGSSGNASCHAPHLHFELHDPWGVIVNPYESLLDPVTPAYCTDAEVGCWRIAGSDRYATAAEVSQAHHPNPADVTRVYVTSGENFPDALAGAGVSGALHAPLLLVRSGSIPDVVAEEITRLAADEIVILGGPSAVSAGVEAALGGPAFGSPTVARISGSDRYETAVAISQHNFADGEPDAVVIASGETFADALAAGPLATMLGAPVLLTGGTDLPAIVADEILRLAPSTVYVLGGPAVIADSVLAHLGGLAADVQRIFGLDRYATAVTASLQAFPEAATPVDRIYVTVGTAFPDGLTGGGAAGMLGAPLLLVPPSHLPDVVRDEILRLAPGEIVIFGGPNSVGSAVELALRNLIDGG